MQRQPLDALSADFHPRSPTLHTSLATVREAPPCFTFAEEETSTRAKDRFAGAVESQDGRAMQEEQCSQGPSAQLLMACAEVEQLILGEGGEAEKLICYVCPTDITHLSTYERKSHFTDHYHEYHDQMTSPCPLCSTSFDANGSG